MTLLFLFAVDRHCLLPATVRAGAAATLLGFTATLLYSKSLVYILRRTDKRQAARALEASHPEFGGLALSAAELSLGEATRSSVPSREFAQLTVDAAAARAQRACEASAVPLGPIFIPVAMVLAVACAWGITATARPRDVSVFLGRVFDPASGVLYEGRTRIVAVEYPAAVARGGGFTATASVAGVVPEYAVFRVMDAAGTETAVTAASRDGRFDASLERVMKGFDFYVTAGDARSAKYAVEVVDRPAVTSVSARITPPAYTGLAEVRLPGGDIQAPKGSTVELGASFSKSVRWAEIVFEDGARVPATMGEGSTGARFTFPADKTQTYRMALVDEAGFVDSGSMLYAVTADADAAPGVEVLRPTRDMTVVNDARLPIHYRASDDYGLSALELLCSVRRGGVTEELRLPVTPAPSGRTAAGSFEYDFRRLALSAGDEVTFRLRATDNLPGEAQSGESGAFSVLVVTAAEKLEEIERISARAQAAVRSAARSQEESIAALASDQRRTAR